MVLASQLRSGMAIRLEGQSYKVMSAQYHPGQGKMGGVAHVRLRNLATGAFWDHSFRAESKLEVLATEKQNLQYLYSDGEQCYFMNPRNYEQVGVPKAILGEQARFLQPEMELPVEFVAEQPVSVVFPDIIEVRVSETSPPVHGQQDSTWKTARLENGLEILVPQFIKSGDLIRLQVESLKYVDRARSGGKS